MQRTRYTPEQRAEALGMLAELGKAETARRLGIPEGTIAAWGSRSGVTAPPAEQTRTATAARLATMAERKAELAAGLVEDIARLRADLFAPTIERKAMAAGHMRQVEIVEINHATTTAAERRTTIQAITGAIEAVQLLTGEATQRIENLSAGPRSSAEILVDELEQRRQAKAS